MEGGLVRVSSLRVRNAVLHDLTAATDDDNAAIDGVSVLGIGSENRSTFESSELKLRHDQLRRRFSFLLLLILLFLIFSFGEWDKAVGASGDRERR